MVSNQAVLESRLAAAQATNARGRHRRAIRAFEEIVAEVEAQGDGATREAVYVAARAGMSRAVAEFELSGS
ncbi:hypothetical protein, partial [Cellulosimicrobium sp. CpK407]